jgi:hypothetical protein
MLDACVLLRFIKCNKIPSLQGKPRLLVAGQVIRESRKRPVSRDAVASLDLSICQVTPGTPEWEIFCRLRGGTYSNQNLGEIESVAVCLARADQGDCVPFITYDERASRLAREQGVLTMDFLDTLAWLLGCGVIDEAEAGQIEQAASRCDGWRRPRETESEKDLVALCPARQQQFVVSHARWSAR